MPTFKAYFKKEIIESVRQYKYIIMAAGIILFAIADPIMLKVLPEMLKGQLSGDISSLIKIDFNMAVQNYIKDLSQISYFIVILALMGILSDEIYKHKLVFPYTKGLNPAALVLSKVLHYSIALVILIFAGFAINYYYAYTLFEGNVIPFSKVMSYAMYISIYYVYTVVLLTFFSSLFKKSILAVISLLVVDAISAALMNISKISAFIPARLLSVAGTPDMADITKTIVSVAILCIIFFTATVIRMNRIENL
ncbi:MAG TPA: ABC transporter permease [Clostridiaceae bacterium]|nr:ABC transporter permease [Clostridiaceae bacterium]